MAIIALVGGVGVGKTRAGRKLKELLPSAVYIEEDTANNLYLNEFYSDMQKWGFHSRISMLAMVLENTAQAMNAAQNGSLVILDRCIEELIVFAVKEYEEKNLTEKEFALYRQLYRSMLDVVPRPDVFVYFHCDPQTAFKRIISRGRKCEQSVDLAFCEDVQARYDLWRDSLEDRNVIDIRSDQDLDYYKLRDEILSHIDRE